MRNCPENMGVKKEDWYVFVDMEATEDARLRRERGKACRKEMNNPHTTGRRGTARTAEILVANNPNEEGTRTDFFIATHTRPDGTYLNEAIGERMVGKIQNL
ncbi:hypothetical protein FRX31_002502 [Thalictrum thalictroides]|uniref:Uncharacterized protein n=1 Tax=Thalictrum thalictroides TaxID=46969 RepID=A0A7J6XDM9_THATH|nr:hypothetical protein FRX31_002502 [Thalictrum thalictroides]